MSSRLVVLVALGAIAMAPALGWTHPGDLDPLSAASPGAGIDGASPRVVATLPADGATGVAVGANLTISFDAPMNTTSVVAAFGITPAISGDFAWTANGTVAWFGPHLFMRYDTQYRVRLTGSVARDLSGEPLDGNGDGVGGDDFVFRFTTEADIDPPRVLEVSPTANSVNASVTADIEILFSEPMVRASVEGAFSYTDGSVTRNASAGTFSWDGRLFADDTATFNPFENLPFAAYITVTQRASAQDPAGYGLDGDANGRSDGSPRDDVVWMFATEASDSTPPRVVAVDPANEATGVPETTAVTLTFTEAMSRTTVANNFALRDDVRNWTQADGLFSWNPGQDAATYTPSGILSVDSEYHVSLGSAAADVNGNALGAPFTASFRTRLQPDVTPPHVLSRIPKDGDPPVPREPILSITFDDGMDTARTEEAISLLTGTEPGPITIPLADFQWYGANHTVSFRPSAALDWNSSYTVRVSQAARDDAGLALPTPYSFAFRTESWSGRVLGRVVDGEVAAVPGASVTLVVTNLSSGSSSTLSGVTDSTGRASMTWRNAPAAACYRSVVNKVVASGLTWDGATPTNGSCPQ